jgi:hypothetical protein
VTAPAARETHVFSIPMTTRFRGITTREGMLLRGPAGWGELSPFLEYDARVAAPWLRCALEAADEGWPEPLRGTVPVNVTVPAVGPEQAVAIVRAGDAATKDGEPRPVHAEAAISGGARRPRPGAVRIDVSGWAMTGGSRHQRLDRAATRFVNQQPCGLGELAPVRRRVDVPSRPMIDPSAGPTASATSGGRRAGSRSAAGSARLPAPPESAAHRLLGLETRSASPRELPPPLRPRARLQPPTVGSCRRIAVHPSPRRRHHAREWTRGSRPCARPGAEAACWRAPGMRRCPGMGRSVVRRTEPATRRPRPRRRAGPLRVRSSSPGSPRHRPSRPRAAAGRVRRREDRRAHRGLPALGCRTSRRRSRS